MPKYPFDLSPFMSSIGLFFAFLPFHPLFLTFLKFSLFEKNPLMFSDEDEHVIYGNQHCAEINFQSHTSI